MADPRLVFVLSPYQNVFFSEVADALVDELTELGAEAVVHTKDVPDPDRRDVYVLLPPHEYFTLEGDAWTKDTSLLARTIFLSAEQPSSPFFAGNIAHAAKAGAVFDFSPLAVEQYRLLGVNASWLPFGWTPTWDHHGRPADERSLDVLFLGCITPRRERLLAELAPVVERLRAQLIVSDNSAPNTADSGSFIAGDAKRRLLGTTRIVVNLHQTDEPYFEWLRASEAAMAGAVVLSEPSVGTGYFVPNEHFACSSLGALPQVLAELSENPDWQKRLRSSAYEVVRNHPLSAGAAQLLAAAHELAEQPVPMAVPGPKRLHPYQPEEAVVWRMGESDDAVVLRQVLREVRLDQMELSRQLDAVVRLQSGAQPLPLEVIERSPSRRAQRAPARVSVLVALYNHADYVTGALNSVAAGTYRDFEIIVVDDGSKDSSQATVRRWMDAHPRVAATLLRHPINRGLPVSRNDALAFAESEFVFVLDADNEIAPRGLERLVWALDANIEAWFAYGLMQRFDGKGPVGLMGYFPFSPERLRAGNYIDAMALIRRSRIVEMGGYTTDRRLYGWEDYDLWCRMAEGGGRGAHVSTLVGRYRTSPTSMLAVSNISHLASIAALREHCPLLMGDGP